MIRFLRHFHFPVDKLLPGSRLQAMKEILYADDERREKERKAKAAQPERQERTA